MQKIRPDLDIGKNMHKLRIQSKLKQEQVVTQMQIMSLNISKNTYTKIETNRMNTKVSELLALKIIFKSTIDSFF